MNDSDYFWVSKPHGDEYGKGKYFVPLKVQYYDFFAKDGIFYLRSEHLKQ